MTAAIHHPDIVFTLLKTFDLPLKNTIFSGFQSFKNYQYYPVVIPKQETQTQKETHQPDFISVEKKDKVVEKNSFQGTLFSCILYLIEKKANCLKDEMQEKQKMVVALGNGSLDKKRMKTVPFRLTKSELEEIISDLITWYTRTRQYDSCFGIISIDLHQIILYSYFYQKNIIVFCFIRKILLPFIVDESYESIYLKLLDTQQGCTLFETVDSVPDMSEWVKAESCQSVLKAISHYKLGDLQTIYEKLFGNSNLESKKQEMYKEIQSFSQNKFKLS